MMKKFTQGFLAFLFTLVAVCTQAQSSNVNIHFKDVTNIDSSGLNLNVCGKYDTITLYIGNKTGIQTLTNVVVRAGIVGGMHYIPGTAFVTTTLGGTTSSDPLTENATDVQNPKFTLTNGMVNGISRYVRFLVQADCNVFEFIGSPMYNVFTVDFKVSGTSYQNTNETPQPYNNAFHITNIPQPTWVTNQNMNIINGQQGCRQFYIQNTTATAGYINLLQLYDIHTPGLIVTYGISRTAGGATTALTTTISGDTTFGIIDASKLIAAGFGDSLGSNQRIYITECVQVNTCTAGTYSSNVGFQWGFCFAGPCQDQSTTAAVQISIGGPSMGGGLDPTSVFNKCTGTQSTYQVFNYINTGNGPAANLKFNLAFDTTTYSMIDTGTFQVDTTGTGASYVYMKATYTAISNTFPNCFNSKVFKTATGTIPKVSLAAGGKILVRFKMKTCCPTNCGTATIAGWSASGTYTSTCSGVPVSFGAGSQPVATVGLSAKYSGPLAFTPSSSYTIPWTINDINYSNWGNDANAQWQYSVTLPSFFNFTAVPANVTVKDINNVTWTSTSVTFVGGVVTAKFNFPAPGGFNYHNAKFLLNVTTVACTPAACASYTYVNIPWSAAYVADRTCASTCAMPVTCLSSRVRIYPYCTTVACVGCPLDSFSFIRTSVGQPDVANNGTPNGAALPAGAQLHEAMYKDTMNAYMHVTSYSKTNNANLLAFIQVENANTLSYVGGTVSIFHKSTGLTYNCTLPAPTTATYAGAGPNDLEYKWTINSSTVSGCSPALPILVLDSTDKVTINAKFRVTTNVGWTNEYVGDVKPGVAITSSSSLPDASYADCGWFDRWSVIGYQLTSQNESNAVIPTCGTGTLGSSYAYYTFLGNAGEHPFPYEYRDWAHIDNFTQAIPAGYQYIPGTARIVYQRTNGDNSFVTTTKFVTPTLTVSGTDTIVNIDVKNSAFGGGSPLLYSTDGWKMTILVDIKAIDCNTGNVTVNTNYTWTEGVAPNQHIKSGDPYFGNVNGNNTAIHQDPGLFITPAVASILGTGHNLTWQVQVGNNTSAASPNTWFSAYSNDSTQIKITSIRDITTGNVLLIPADTTIIGNQVGYMYHLGTLAGNTTKTYVVSAYYNSCTDQPLILQMGFNCNPFGYPVGLQPQSAGCGPVLSTLTATSVPAKIQTNVVEQPNNSVQLCDTSLLGVQLASVDYGRTFADNMDVFVPLFGLTPIPGTWQIKFPQSGSYVTIPNPTLSSITPLGKRYVINFSNLVAYIKANGLANGFDLDTNAINLHFKATTDCNYFSGARILYRGRAQDLCGQNLKPSLNSSNKINIQTIGANPLQSFGVRIIPQNLVPCKDTATRITEVIYNTGPFPTDSFTSLVVVLTPGLAYHPGTNVNLGTPVVTNLPGGVTQLTFPVPAGLTVADSLIVSYLLDVVDSGFNRQFTITTDILNSIKAICKTTGDTCDISEITGSFSDTLSIGTPKFKLTSIYATSTCNAPSGEAVTVNYSILNQNLGNNFSIPITINLWWDSLGTGVLNTAKDIKVGTQQINTVIDSGQTYNGVIIFNVPSPHACRLIFQLDSITTKCLPLSLDTLLPNVHLKNAGGPIAGCTGASTRLGCNGTSGAITGYTYTWTAIGAAPAAGSVMSCTNCANPLFTFPANNTGVNIVYQYKLSTTRGATPGCVNLDTAFVTVYPIVHITANAVDSDICLGQNSVITTTVSPGGGSYTWTPATYLSSTTAATVTSTPTVAGNITYKVLYNLNGCLDSSYKTIRTYTVPTASAGPNITKCIPIGPSFTIGGSPTGTGGSGSFSYAWSPNTNLSSTTVANPTYTGTTAVNRVYTVTVTDNVSGCTATSSMRLIIASSVTTTNSKPNLCLGENSVLVATGLPLGNGTYSWSPTTGMTPAAGNTATVTVSPAVGTYTYTVTYTESGCVSTASTVVNVYALPVASAGPNKTQCLPSLAPFTIGGSPTGSSGSGSYTYAWTPATGLSSTTMANPTFTPTGTVNQVYTVTVTDALTGCQATSTMTVIIASTVTIAAVDTDICLGQNAVLTATGSPAGGSYAWSPTVAMNPVNGLAAQVTVNPAASQTYIVTYTLSGCSSTAQKKVNVYSIPVANAGPDQTYCLPHGTVTLGAGSTASGGSGSFSYAWSPATGLSSTTVANPTIATPVVSTTKYFVTVTDLISGCAAIDSMVLTINSASTVTIASPDTDICVGQSTTLTASGLPAGGTYQWTPTTAMTPALGNTATVTVAPAATQTYIVNYTTAGCGSSAQVKVNVYPTVLAHAGGNQTYCLPHGTVTLGGSPTATGGSGTFTYAWSPSTGLSSTTAANPTIASPSAGSIKYFVTVTDTKSGCNSVDSMILTLNTTASVSVSSVDTDICVGQTSILIATGTPAGGTYQWSPTTAMNPAAGNTATVTVSPAATQTYIITYTSSGCTATAQKTVNVFPGVVAHSGGNQTYCLPHGTVTLGGSPTATGGSGSYTYSWSPSTGLSSTTVANPTIGSPTAGAIKYFVTVTDVSTGCTGVDSMTLTLNSTATVTIASADTDICVSQSAILVATGSPAGGTYQWAPLISMNPIAGNTATVTVSPSSNQGYQVTYTLAGCTGTAVKSINVYATPVAHAGGDQTYCLPHGTVTLGGTPTATGGSGTFTYSWSPATGLSSTTVANPTIASPAAGTIKYFVTVTDSKSGCTSVDSMTLILNSSATVTITSVDTDLCQGQSTVLIASGAPAGGTYQWSPTIGMTPVAGNVASVTVAPSSTQAYLVTYTTSGCSGTASKTVNIYPNVSADAGPDQTYCLPHGTVTIGGSPTAAGGSGTFTYSWSPTTGLSSATAANPTISSPVTGTTKYFVTVTDTKSGCTSIDSMTLVINATATVSIAVADSDLCSGQSAILVATGAPAGGAYQWSPTIAMAPAAGNTATVTVNPASTQTYQVTYTLAGCSGTASKTVNIYPTVVAHAGGNQTYCLPHGTVTLGGSPTATSGFRILYLRMVNLLQALAALLLRILLLDLLLREPLNTL